MVHTLSRVFTMSDARSVLLDQIVTEVAANGLADRSLRELAAAVGSSHRMLIYHFDSRAGLVAAIVEVTEAAQRELLVEMASVASDPGDLVLKLWHRVSSLEMRPFVRLFFECVAVTEGKGLTDPWLEVADNVARSIGLSAHEDDLRLGVAVTRGLLIDVLTSGDTAAATTSMERFIEISDL